MKFSKDIGFAVVYREKPIDRDILSAFKPAFALNKKIFKRTPRKFKIIICDNQKDLKKEAKYYYQKWMTATVLRNNNLVIKSPDFIEKKSKFKRKDFPDIVNHEMNHLFWTDFYKTINPVWLIEGFACHVGNNFILSKKELKKLIKKYKIDYSFIEYRYLKKNFKAGHTPRYQLWATFTRYIADKYSTAKIVKLLDAYDKDPTRKRYDKLFKQIFGKTEKELFSDFLGSL